MIRQTAYEKMFRVSSECFSVTVIITVLKSVDRKRLVKTEVFYVNCDCNDNWSVWFSETYKCCVKMPLPRNAY
jgi:hypothetical protein